MTREERNATMLLMYKSGVTLQSIGESFGITKQAVHRIVNYGQKLARFDWTEQRIAVLRTMHADGRSVADMAKAVGCSYGSARHKLIELDLLEWTSARRNHLRRLASEGVHVASISKQFGISHHAIRREAERLGIELREKAHDPEKPPLRAPSVRPDAKADKGVASSEMQRRQIRFLAAKGWPPADVARQVRCEVRFVEEVLA